MQSEGKQSSSFAHSVGVSAALPRRVRRRRFAVETVLGRGSAASYSRLMADSDKHDADILNDYIERLLAVEGDGQRVLDDDDLRRVARELGLSDDDLARVDQVVADHLTRGQNFAARSLYDDAVTEIHQAAVLRPFDKDIATQLADAYLGQFRVSGSGAARQRAQRWARRAIAIDAGYQPAFDVLEQCGKPHLARTRMVAALMVAVVTVALVGGGVAAVWLSQSGQSGSESESGSESQSGGESEQVTTSPDTSGPVRRPRQPGARHPAHPGRRQAHGAHS